jgi:hypothetical protein
MRGDGEYQRYHMLANLAAISPTGILIEIGFRAGTGVMAMTQGKEYSPHNLYIAVDPYGNIPYKIGNVTTKYDYTNDRRRYTLKNFYQYLAELPNVINFTFYNLESIEFFNRYEDGVPDYFSGDKLIRNDYSLVHLDGQHDTESVLQEVNFFAPRIQSGGFIVIDDTESNWMDMDIIETALTNNNYRKHESSIHDKWAYIKE